MSTMKRQEEESSRPQDMRCVVGIVDASFGGTDIRQTDRRHGVPGAARKRDPMPDPWIRCKIPAGSISTTYRYQSRSAKSSYTFEPLVHPIPVAVGLTTCAAMWRVWSTAVNGSRHALSLAGLGTHHRYELTQLSPDAAAECKLQLLQL